eukprot:m.255278 g.255278  ORF g.255278 m.255278 type:complete len:103 (+) comp40393_c0_seq26:928-1236(+)
MVRNYQRTSSAARKKRLANTPAEVKANQVNVATKRHNEWPPRRQSFPIYWPLDYLILALDCSLFAHTYLPQDRFHSLPRSIPLTRLFLTVRRVMENDGHGAA